MRASRHSISLAFALALAVVTGCSVDEFSNPQRKTSADCTASGGTLLAGKFCVPDAGQEAGTEGCSEEGALELCYDGKDQATSLQPPCRAGSRTCRDGVWSACEQQVLPMDETCNGSDDDCDGRVDEHMEPTACTLDSLSGVCSRGVLVCLAGRDECAQVEHPSDDVCNGEDDDCDGEVDEATAQTCYDAPNDAAVSGCTSDGEGHFSCQGACTAGEIRCVDGQYADTCEGSVTPAEERCSSDVSELAQDEDCDGHVDEGCTCLEGASCYNGSPPTTQGVGPCHAGHRHCNDATHGTCEEEVTPKPEDCSNPGRDDDCNGSVDDVPSIGQSCADDSHAEGACQKGAVWQCVGDRRSCVDAAKAAETCDGTDEDCDGHIDEDFTLDSDPLNCGACGTVCAANTVCCDGNCVDTQSSNLHCNGCGNACTTGNTCCGGSCVNTKSDAAHCGRCDNSCEGLQSCSNSACKTLGIL